VIAHALVRRPSLLIADDPTVGLGMTDRDLIVGLLRSTATDQGVGILMAVPDFPAMVQADRVHSLGRGHLLSAAAAPRRDNVVEFPGGRGSG
jgi:ABC-type glutathione transport system ATPase component